MNDLKWLLPSLRPREWYKNLLIFSGIIFTGNLFNSLYFVKSLLAAFVFCIASGAVYIFNDLLDKPKDEFHPLKRGKIIFKQNISLNRIEFALGILIIGSLFAAFLLNTYFGLVVLIYFIIAVLYSYLLREMPLIDILTLALIFALIAAAGFIVINEAPSPWVVSTVFFLGLFLITAERRHELEILADEAPKHRKVFEVYSKELLDQLLLLFSSSTVLMYCISTLLGDSTIRLRAQGLIFTLPFVIYGITRYMILLKSKESTSKLPEDILLQDKPLLICAGIWVVLIFLFIYVFHG